MYKWERERPLMEKETIPRRRRTPSFSSSLLDAIYRSIDESKAVDQEEEDLGGYGLRDRAAVNININNTKKKQKEETKEKNNLRRALMIDSWVEKLSVQSSSLSNSASSSSAESSSGALWSSSETESSRKQRSKMKSFRASGVMSSHSEKKLTVQLEQRISSDKQQQQQKKKPKAENNGGFSKTKLKALKIYGELKKVKQPISPGGRIASFLNSIFSSGNVKKAKMCYVGAVEDVTSDHISKSTPCSSATSAFSRSCLTKTTSSSTSRSAKHGNNGNKRSVRFYPVSVILGEDSKPCGHKYVYEEDPSLMPLSAIRGFVRSSSLKEDPRKENGAEREARSFLRGFCDINGEADDEEEEEEEDDDDAESYSSSDLFELDHLVGIGRYREELPVYETTSLKTNQAIANGFIL